MRFTLAAGKPVWRTLRASDATQAVQYAQECYASPAHTRFAPLKSGGATIPIAYVAATREVSLWEVILRGITHESIKLVPSSETTGRFTSR